MKLKKPMKHNKPWKRKETQIYILEIMARQRRAMNKRKSSDTYNQNAYAVTLPYNIWNRFASSRRKFRSTLNWANPMPSHEQLSFVTATPLCFLNIANKSRRLAVYQSSITIRYSWRCRQNSLWNRPWRPSIYSGNPCPGQRGAKMCSRERAEKSSQYIVHQVPLAIARA